MRKAFLIMAMFLFMLPAFADRGAQIVGVIDEELREITRLNKQIGGRKPHLLLRMAELLLEKARIIKESENKRYLSIPIAKRRRLKKSNYFKKSRAFFRQAQKTCKLILKRFRRFKQKGDVYYIMAYNAREFQDYRASKRYFSKSIRHSTSSSITTARAKLALAGMYFNEGNFRKAIPLYEAALRKEKNRWYTQDQHSLSWCYYRIRRTKQAINKMHKVFRDSKNSKYVDMSATAKKDLGLFYADIGKINKLVAFYKRAGGDPVSDLLTTIKRLMKKGKYSSAEKLLRETKKINRDGRRGVEINIMLIAIYERSVRTNRHYKILMELVAAYKTSLLVGDDLSVAKYQAKKMAALLQRQVVGRTYRHRPKLRASKRKMAIKYFGALKELEPTKVHEIDFAIAETLYASNKFDRAIRYYDLSNKGAVAKNDRKTQKLAFTGLMASLGQRGISKKTKDKYLVYAYNEYLKRHPRSKKAHKIYQRLFTDAYGKKNIPESERILFAFKRSFPKSAKTQEAMLARVMDYYKDRNDKNAIKGWVARINKGEFKVSRRYAKKLRQLLLTMQFEDVEKSNSTGDKKQALRGYVSIYKDATATKDARKNAAYNIAILFYELGRPNIMFDWSKRALSLMKNSDIVKFQTSFIAIATDLFNRRQFAQSVFIYESVFKRVCRTRSKNKKILFKNSVIINIANRQSKEAEKVVAMGARCNITKKYINDAKLDILKAMIKEGRWNATKGMIKKLERVKHLVPELIYPMGQLRQAYLKSGRRSEAYKVERRMIKQYRQCKRQRRAVPLEALDQIASFQMDGLRKAVKAIASVKLQFPEKRYNIRLRTKFKRLDVVTSRAIGIFRIGSGKGIVEAYKHLVESYGKLVAEIKGFTPPKKSANYIKSFKKSMVRLVAPIAKKEREFRKEAEKQIVNNEILSDFNNYFIIKSRLPVNVRYSHPKRGVIMDRGGRR